VGTNAPAQAVLVTGGLGAGKTAVAVEMGEALETAGAPYAVLDLDWLCWAWAPALTAGGLHRLLCENLRAVLPNMLAAGVRHLVMARAVLTADGVTQLRDAIAPTRMHIVRLTAAEDATIARLQGRDTGSRLAAHLNRRVAFEQMVRAATPQAHVVDTTSDDAATTALQVLRLLDWPRGAPEPGQ
jgi:hypothetical protein